MGECVLDQSHIDRAGNTYIIFGNTVAKLTGANLSKFAFLFSLGSSFSVEGSRALVKVEKGVEPRIAGPLSPRVPYNVVCHYGMYTIQISEPELQPTFILEDLEVPFPGYITLLPP